MQEYRRNLSVGLFMLFGVVALGALVILYGELPEVFGRATYAVTIRFEAVGGVQEGTPLYMQGLLIGKVDEMKYRDASHPEEGVDVIAKIEQQYTIPSTAEAEVASQAIGFARPVISVILQKSRAEAVVPKDGSGVIVGKTKGAFEALIPAETRHSMEKTMHQISTLAEKLLPVADDLHRMLEDRPIEKVDDPAPGEAPLRGNLSTAAVRLDSALKHFNAILGDPENRSNIKVALENFRALSEEGKAAVSELKAFAENANEISTRFKGVAGKVEGVVDHTSEQLDRMFRALIDDADKLSRVLDHLDKASRDLAEGNGTAGRLLRDPRLYEELTVTAKRLTKAIDTFDALLKKWREEGLNVKF